MSTAKGVRAMVNAIMATGQFIPLNASARRPENAVNVVSTGRNRCRNGSEVLTGPERILTYAHGELYLDERTATAKSAKLITGLWRFETESDTPLPTCDSVNSWVNSRRSEVRT